jgi:hypothetical protein
MGATNLDTMETSLIPLSDQYGGAAADMGANESCLPAASKSNMDC